MRLVRITETLYVNPERVLSVERRTVEKSDGTIEFTELTMDNTVRWKLDVDLDQVVNALTPDIR